MRRKDNLTDLVEDLRDRPVGEISSDGKWEVVGNNGETITLEVKSGKRVRIVLKGRTLEVSAEQLDRMIQSAVQKQLAEIAKKIAEQVSKEVISRRK
ncbi:MAG TPA: hypothetical protein VHC20_04945 [Candidatus Paceibacterota bacterium]|nr:hypothetical protein [Candidatus Paceibacterota bacterium]